MTKPCNLIEFKNDELMEDFIHDLFDNIGFETEDEYKYGVQVQYVGKSLTTGKELEFTSYLKEKVIQDLVNARAFLLR